MRPSLRFLGLAVIGWAGLRAAALGVLPGAEIFRIERSEAKPPPIVPTEFPPIEPIACRDRSAMRPAEWLSQAAMRAGGRSRRSPFRSIIAARFRAGFAAGSASLGNVAAPCRRRAFYSPIPALDEWPLSRIASAAMPAMRSSVVDVPAQSPPLALRASASIGFS